MRVIITGGCGFLGQMLARSIVRRGTLTTHLLAAGGGGGGGGSGGAANGGEGAMPVSEVLLADVARPERLMFNELESQQSRVVLGSVAEVV